MHHHYLDIRKQIPTQIPLWFDEHAVPRYDAFTPGQLADIYADECCLAEIACQSCGHCFSVAFSVSMMSKMKYHWRKLGCIVSSDNITPEQIKKARVRDFINDDRLANDIRNGSLHYGDPPNIECCPAGPTMNREMLKVIEYWKKGKHHEWVRDAALEIDFQTGDV